MEVPVPRVRDLRVLVVRSVEGEWGQRVGVGVVLSSSWGWVREFSQVVVRVGGGACIAAWWEEGFARW